MQESERKRSPAAEYLIKTFCDPVLWYTVIAMSAIMYHYYDNYAFHFTVASFAVTYVLFRLFDYINKHRLIGFFAYCAAGYLCYLLTLDFIRRGYDYYEEVLNTKPINYGLWFITPQLALDYNIWYSCGTFMLFSFFMASVIYYFTRVRYRVFMSFLIFMMPFIIYGKEYELMPIPYVVSLLIGYIVLMVYCRQLRGDVNTVIVRKMDLFSSAGVFITVFAVVASVCPKPIIHENREGIETLISAEKFTDKLVASLSSLRGSSSGGQFRRVNSSVQLYYAEADEELRLKTRTFTNYDYDLDIWSATEADSDREKSFDYTPFQVGPNTGELARAILYAAELDSDFAESYGLTGLVGKEITVPPLHSIKLYTAYDSGRAIPVPQDAQSLTDTSYDGKFTLISSGTIVGENANVRIGDSFTFSYTEESFFDNATNRELIDAVSRPDYYVLLIDADNILYKEMRDSEVYSDRYEKAAAAYRTVANERDVYRGAQYQLEYSDNVRIKELADEITAGLPTEYDKVKALELYFYENGFNYDLEYLKSQGENVENFLFNTKRGVCYEYATAMVMLARSIGIPARYCEGFSMSSKFTNNRLGTNYVITAKDSHGYPELYIKGYGWVSFEPTRSDGQVEQQREKEEASNGIKRAGTKLFIGALILLVGYIASPFVIHRLFIIICRRKKPSAAAIAVMRRICRVYGISAANTSMEAAEAVRIYSGADITEAAELFDAAAYGGDELSENDRDKLIDIYIRAYDAYRTARKRNRRLFAGKT